MLQETGLETTNTWRVWQNPDAETVDSNIENARELIKRQEAELPPQKEENNHSTFLWENTARSPASTRTLMIMFQMILTWIKFL